MNLVMRSAARKLCAAVAVVVASYAPALAGGVPVFVDTNDNGIFDGLDVDVSQDVRDGVPVSTPHSIVVSEGTTLRLRAESTTLLAGRSIHIGGVLTTTGSILLRTETGPITLGPRSLMTADNMLQVVAAGDLTLERARVQGDNWVMLESLGGRIDVGRSVLNGGTRLEINGWATDGPTTIDATTMQSPRGMVNIHIAGPLQMHRVTTVARDVNIAVGGGIAEIGYSTIRVARTGVLAVTVEPSPAVGPLSTLDVSTSRLYAAPGNLLLMADQIIGQ